MIDSGAESSAFPFEVADTLGVPLPALLTWAIRYPSFRRVCLVLYGWSREGRRQDPFETAGGKARDFTARDYYVTAEFGGDEFGGSGRINMPLTFCASGAIIFGRAEFFTRYEVTVDEAGQKIRLKEYGVEDARPTAATVPA